MSKKKILVLTDHMPWGHRSIARAIYSYLKKRERENNWKVDYAQVQAETGLLGDMYTLAYRFFPKTNRIAHQLMGGEGARRLFEEVSVVNLPRLKKLVNWMKPDLIISAYFYHSHSLARWRLLEGKKFALWTVAADPWTINPATFVREADLSLVYDGRSKVAAMKFGIEEEKILETGWWVREEMYDEKLRTKNERLKIRKKLGFDDERPVIFVGGGSLGTNALSKILPVLAFVRQPVGLVFNSGTDKLGYNLVAEYSRMFKRIRKDDVVRIKNLGWIENMAEILSACDIVFGKAGPNFLFDVVAAGKPFVAITHIGGQEDGNIELIRKKKLGWVKEKNGELTDFFLEYIKRPKSYQEKYMESIEREAERNRHSMEKIEERIKAG